MCTSEINLWARRERKEEGREGEREGGRGGGREGGEGGKEGEREGTRDRRREERKRKEREREREREREDLYYAQRGCGTVQGIQITSLYGVMLEAMNLIMYLPCSHYLHVHVPSSLSLCSSVTNSV